MNMYRPFNNEIVVVEDFLSEKEIEILYGLFQLDESFWEASNDGSGLKDWYGNQLEIDLKNLKEHYAYYKNILTQLEERGKALFIEAYGVTDFEMMPITRVSRRINSTLGVHQDEVPSDHPQYDPEEKPITYGLVAYINDDYEGGEIFYPEKNLFIKPKARSLVMHPGSKEYAHGVKYVEGSVRYSISWFIK